jgi:D-glycero-D-manno-heptose 1,7-bisphosphate phosphatase
MRRVVFLDKDGTLVEDEPPNIDTSRVHFYPDVFPALRLLARAGFALVIVTNQNGIAQGRCEESDIHRMLTYFRDRFADERLTLDGFYYCPHDADGVIAPYAVPCLCRKPRPGLLMRARRDLDIDMTQSWMVGDILHDVEAGRWAGCRTVLINNGHETEWRLTETRWPDHIAETMLKAAQLIVLAGERRARGALAKRYKEEW